MATNKLRSELSDFQYFRFSLCDIHGRSRGVIVPHEHVAKHMDNGIDIYEGILMDGAEFENITIPSKKGYNHGNMTILPQIDTLRPVPWSTEGKFQVGEVLCESHWKKDGSPQEACPRYVARQQLQRLDDLGFKLFSSFEMECVLLHTDTMKPLFHNKGYMCHKNQNQFSRLLLEVDQQLRQSHINVERIHTESGPGKMEACLKPSYGIESADAALNFKQGMTEIMAGRNITASFMSMLKLHGLEASVEGHFNHSLQCKHSGKLALYDESCVDKLSVTAKMWMAGIIKHSKALTALVSPTVNCYRRLHRLYIPSGIFWGIEDREASLRIKNHGPAGTYFENRLPSGLSNPYIVMAATVAAGLDGIINKLECPPSGTKSTSEPLPNTLDEALEALKEDTELILALGEEFCNWFICNRKFEIGQFKKLTTKAERHALELQRYL